MSSYRRTWSCRELKSGNICLATCAGAPATTRLSMQWKRSWHSGATMSADAASPTGIGARLPRRELKRLLSGHGRYIDDIKLPRMLHAYFVRSPHPHAKLVSLNVTAAKEAPGVVAVFTAADINP